MNSKSIRIFNEGSLPTIDYKDLNDFQGDFKTITRDSLNRLKNSIIKHGIFLSKKVWIDSNGKYWTLDGHQTLKALAELDADNWNIPDIPIEPIYAVDEGDAVRKLLQISSEYGKVNKDSKFLLKNDFFDVSELLDIELPGLDLPDVDEILKGLGLEIDLGSNEVVKGKDIQPPDEKVNIADARQEKFDTKIDELNYLCEIGDIWKLGNNYLVCADSSEPTLLEKLKSGLLPGYNFDNVDMMFFDPPFQDDLTLQQSIFDNWGDFYTNNLLIMTSRKVLSGMDFSSHNLVYSHDLVWDRVNPHLGANLQRPLMYHVPIDVYSKNKRKKLFNRHNDWVKRIFDLDRIPSIVRIADQKRLDKILDRGAKPLKLMIALFATYSDSRIVDVCVGNGVSFVAGHTIGRQVLGIEVDPKMCIISQAYFERETGIKPEKLGNIYG